MKVLIIGGVAGGASAAARLRRLGENVEIIMFEKGEYISFANCGLPYYIGEEITDKSELTLQTPESFKANFNIDVRIFNEVISINPEAKTVKVRDVKSGAEYEETYDKLVLSPGAEPIKPSLTGTDDARVFTLRNIPDTYRIKDYIDNKNPKSAVVVGGGYIGVEMAENLKSIGLDVTIVELADHLIAPLDKDMACDVQNYVQSKGIHLKLANGVKAIEDSGDELILHLNNGNIATDMVIMSVGVKPETRIAKVAGIEVNGRGSIIVNENMETSIEDIYAAGDAVEVANFITGTKEFTPLAGPANKQGRIVADNICGIKSRYTGTQGSSILKIFDMTVATTGINEKIAKAHGFDYDKVFTYSASHATYYPGAEYMSIKTIFEKKSGKILGAQIIGFNGVDKRCDVLATAIRAGMTAYDLTELELCYAPPYSSAKDPVNMVGYVIENLLEGQVKNFHWEDISKLPKDGSAIVLDARSLLEYTHGHVEGVVHIPVGELRDRINELDKTKPIYVYCYSGQRSYLACRILTQNGFDCYNISGGYRLYDSMSQW